MKLSCDRASLALATNHAKGVANHRSSLPVIANILLQANGNKLTVTATDLEVRLSMSIDAAIEKNGSVTVPAKTFADLVRTLSDDTVSMELSERTITLSLECGKNKASLKGLAADEFPVVSSGDPELLTVMTAESLQTAMAKAVMAASVDESRPMLTGVLCEFEGDTLTLAAADGFRLARVRATLPNPVEERVEALVPAKSVSKLIRLRPDDDDVKISTAGGTVIFELPDTTLTSQIIQLQFPDYTQIIPQKVETTATFERKQMIERCQAARIFAREAAGALRLNLAQGLPIGSITITAKSEEAGNSSGIVDATIEGEDIEIAVNVAYLLDALKVLDDEKIELRLTQPNSPLLLKPESHDDTVFVVMPMRIDKTV